MVDTSTMAKLLERFAQGVASHDRENPGHNSWGIGMAHFDIERLGLEEGEEILPGIVLEADGGVTGNFRVLCDGQHDSEGEQQEADAGASAALGAYESRQPTDRLVGRECRLGDLHQLATQHIHLDRTDIKNGYMRDRSRCT
jgi:hypothetical protein